MATASRTIAVRLTLEEADQFRAALKAAGTEGEAALSKLGAAAKGAGGDMDKAGASGKLASYQIAQLTAETHKFADQILAGGSALKAFVFQAPNMVTSAGGMKNALAALTSVFTPMRSAALLAVGGVTAMVVAAETADARLVKLRNSLVGYTSDYAALASRIEASSRQQAGALGIAGSDVRSAQTTVAQALPGLSGTDLERSVQLARQFGLTLDSDIGAAVQRLGALAKDPAATIKQLAEQGVPGLSAALVTQVSLMQRSGDRTGAYKVALDALLGSLSGAKMTAAQEGASKLRGEWERFSDYIEHMLAGPGAALESWLGRTLKQMNDFNAKDPAAQAQSYADAYKNAGVAFPDRQAGGNPLAGTTPAASSFAAIYGPPIAAHAMARGFMPEAAMALAALESRSGTQLGGGVNNPYNITAGPGEDATEGFDNYNKRSYRFRNFGSIGAASEAFFDKMERQWTGFRAAGNDPGKIAKALRVGEPGGYAEGIGATLEKKRRNYAAGLQGQMRVLGSTPSAIPGFEASGRRRDIEGPAGNPVNVADYTTASNAARDSSYDGQRAKAQADITATQSNLANAQAQGDTAQVAAFTEQLGKQRAELEKIRTPAQQFAKELEDQAAAAKDATGASGILASNLAKLEQRARDTGTVVTSADRVRVMAATLATVNAEYRKSGEEIERSTKASLDLARGYAESNDAAREAEARQKAYADALKVGTENSPAFNAALKLRTQSYLDAAAAAKAASAAAQLPGLRVEGVTLQAQIDLARRGAGPDETARDLAELKAKQSLDGEKDPVVRERVMAAARENENRRLVYQSIKANTTELQGFMSNAFDRIGADITNAFTQGTSAAEAFGNIGKAVISEITQEFIKLGVINPLKNALYGQDSTLPTLLSVLGIGAKAATGGTYVSPFDGPGMVVPAAHSGAIIGAEATFHRTVDPAVFRGAPRLHEGGIAADEVPAVLRVGEGVFTPGQMKALGAGKGGGSPNIQADFHYHAASGGDGRVPTDEEIARASKTWSREQERNILAIMARERGRPGGILWR